MNRLLRALVLSLACSLWGCSSAEPVVVSKKPPPDKAEVQSERPPGDLFWSPGYWSWEPDTEVFYWTPGAWIAAREGEKWRPGNWKPVEVEGERKWQWTPGAWVRADD
ncbi:MAG: hypothetical protein KDD82_23320 [Planctomycetes bacterium]|nr:hypothetical protein [Planctomycetota bacterium]